MGTPLKSMRLFIPQRGSRASPVLSPLSPVVNSLTVPKSPLLTALYTPTNSKTQPSARKRLEYSQSNVKINLISESPIKKAKQALIVNTPNKYDILRSGLQRFGELNILGRGTFGTVVRGLYSGKDVAVKVVKTKIITNEKNALSLDHENIVKTIDVIMKNEKHSIIVMEYLPDSKVLQSLIDNEKIEMTFSEVVNYCLGITAGLMYIHAQNLIHLDLKPSNVLVSRETCKICDFGNSRFVGDDCKTGDEHIYEGTAQYAAPEILTGKIASCACDTYSLGIFMWQLRYRENPYNSLECRDTIIYNVVKYGLRPRATAREEIADDYSSLYQCCWRVEPTLRPPLATVRSCLMNIMNMMNITTLGIS